MQHDWIWPATGGQLRAFATTAFHAWHATALGDPATYPSPWLPYVVAALVSLPFGSHVGVTLLVGGSLVVAFASMFSLARSLGATPIGALAAAALYEASPVVLNLTHAGHWIELWSYALMPLAIARFRAVPTRWSWLVRGVLFGIASAQFQDAFMGGFAALLLVPRARRTDLCVSLLVGALVLSPEAILGVIDPHVPSLDVFQHYDVWARSQAASLECTVRTLCYIGAYDSVLAAPLRLVLFIPPILAALALVVVRSRVAIATVAVAFVGAVLAAGVDSPLAPLWYWAYEHVAFASVFRENYHFSFLTELGIACAVGLVVTILSARNLTAARAVSMGCIAIAIGVSANVTSGMPTYDFAHEVDAISTLSGRIALDTGILPYATRRDPNHGFVPMLLPVGAAIPVNGSPLKAPLAAAYAALRECRTDDARALLETAGVGAMVPEPRLVSAFSDAQADDVRGMFARSGAASCRVGPLHPRTRLESRIGSERFGTQPTSRDVAIAPEQREGDINTVSTAPSPGTAWARVGLWPTLPEWALLQRPGVFTTRASAEVDVPPSFVLVGSTTGDVHANACVLARRIDAHFELLRCRSHPILASEPPLVVAGIFANQPVLRGSTIAPTERGMTIVRADATSVDAHIAAGGATLLVLHDQFDPLWSLDVPGRHVLVDGFYNGWILAPGPERDVRVRFGGEAPFRLCLAISIALTLASIVVLVATGASSLSRAHEE